MKHTTRLSFVLCGLLGALGAAAVPSPVNAANTPEYNRDVRPILAENCFACHGPDSAARKADLRIDRREDAVSSGAVTPSSPQKSKLIDRVCSDQEYQHASRKAMSVWRSGDQAR